MTPGVKSYTVVLVTKTREKGQAMTDRPKVYPTKQEWMGEVLKPALGEHAQDYDLDAIAYDLLDWHTEYNEQGRGLDNHSGYVENPGLDFWEVVARHEGGRGV